MPNPKLTKRVVDTLEARQSDYVAWCGQLRGFGCRVRPSGSKSFIAQYRVEGGRDKPVRKVTIGTYGSPWTAEQARDEAEKILLDAKRGVDRAEQKATRKAEKTVSEVCDEYLREGVRHKKASTIATDKGRIARHIKPLLGSKRIGSVSKRHIELFLDDVANGKTATDEKTGKHGRAIVKGGRGAATRTVRLLGAIFSYAVDRGYIEKNPRAGVKVFADAKTERFLSGEEMRRLGDAMLEAETVGLPWQLKADGPNAKHTPKMGGEQREVISPFATAAIRLLLLTGCRLREILHLKWAEVDFERGFLRLSDSKTGAKVVVLGAAALKVLADLPRAGDYVIAGRNPKKPRSDIARPWARITAHAGLNDLRLHDLRHSFASVGAGAGMGLGIVGKLLGHASQATTARYAHFADDPLRRASDSIAASIAAAMNSDDDNGKVTELRK